MTEAIESAVQDLETVESKPRGRRDKHDEQVVVEAAEVPGGMWRIVVAGTIVPGPIARIRVPDINNTAPYLAIVEQVAAGGTFALLSTGGYSVQVVK